MNENEKRLFCRRFGRGQGLYARYGVCYNNGSRDELPRCEIIEPQGIFRR